MPVCLASAQLECSGMAYVLVPIILSFALSAMTIPVIIRVARLKNLVDGPDSDRKVHVGEVPTLGGIAIFAGTITVFSSLYDLYGFSDLRFITPALVILFFTGVKDDVLVLAPRKKLAAQFLSAGLITHFGNLRLNSLWGIMGIGEVNGVVGTIITLLTIVSLINAYNFVDGINGLAALLGIFATVFFGTWFHLNEQESLALLSFSLAGSLLGFLIFNYNRAKIFMGDTGSMAVGFILAILAIRFVEINRLHADSLKFYIVNAPAVGFGVLAIPVFDMARVVFSRLFKGKSPFSADRSHFHHIFVDSGISHANSSIILLLINISCVLVVLPMGFARSAWGILLLILYTYFIYWFSRKLLARMNRCRYQQISVRHSAN